MRQLTLNEKITIRGLLARMGVRGPLVVKAELKELIHYWNMCYRRSITAYHRYQ